MKIDLIYFSKLLKVFLESDSAHLTVTDFQNSETPLTDPDGNLDQNFIFHIQLAIDNDLIGLMNRDHVTLKNIGISIGFNGSVVLVKTPIRLTQKGHDFASALNNSEVLKRIKSEFKDAPFKSIFDGSQKLLEHLLKKKLDSLLAE